MKIDLEPGIYVLAVSGGVDSMVLLDILRKRKNIRLVVAHLDHGIRPDSEIDRKLVQNEAHKHGLVFVYDEANLGPDASEDKARKARYKFLHRVQKATGADAIITAHHQDDLIETAILNMLRGTGRKGLSSLADDTNLRRPLLKISKDEIRKYAKEHGLTWRDDLTNSDMKYRRNYIRENIVKKMAPKERKRFVELLTSSKTQNQEIDAEITHLLQFISNGSELDRKTFIELPHKVALEVMAEWLRQNEIRQFDKKLLEKLVATSKTIKPGKQADVNAECFLGVTKTKLALTRRKRY